MRLVHAADDIFSGRRDARPTCGARRTRRAWVAVATQVAFVSDLQPIVSDSAVGFDPQVGPRGIERWNKAPHAGTVVIADDVEIGGGIVALLGGILGAVLGKK